MNQTKTAVSYYRLATADQSGKDDRLTRYKSFVREKANALGVEITAEFEDIGVPAVAEQQLGLQNMMEYLKKNPADYVITPDFAMVSKRIPVLDKYIEKIRQTGAELVSVLGEERMMNTYHLKDAIDEALVCELEALMKR